MSVGKTFEGLPGWAKGAIAVGVVGSLLYAGLMIYRKFKHRKEEKDANKEGEAAVLEVKDLAKDGVYPSFGDTQYQSLCLELVEAITGCGTNEDKVYSAFQKLKNQADILKLISVFGVRYYQPCAASQPVSYAKWLLNDKAFGGSLSTWLSYDLTKKEIDKVNTILAGKGITHRF